MGAPLQCSQIFEGQEKSTRPPRQEPASSKPEAFALVDFRYLMLP